MQTQTVSSNYRFPVILEDAFDLRGKKVPRTKLVVRKDTDDVLSTVSERYNLIPHSVMKDHADDFMKTLGKYDESYLVEKNGARLVMTHTFRDIAINLPGHKLPGQAQVGDTVALRLFSRNSYNTTTPFEIQLGALVLRCLNGATAFDGMFSFKLKHSGVKEIRFPNPDAVVAAFQKQGDAWKTWSNTEVTEGMRERVVAYGKRMQVLTDKAYEENESYFSGSETVWDLYNAVTYVVSHNKRIQESSRINRFNKVNDLFSYVLKQKDVIEVN